MLYFSKIIHYIEKAATYPLKSYISYYRKWNLINIVFIIISSIGILASVLFGALMDLIALFGLILFFPLLIGSILTLCYTQLCLIGAKECKKIIQQINQDIVFVDHIQFFHVDNQSYLLHILKELIRSKNLVNYQLFKNVFLYNTKYTINEKELWIDGKLVQFDVYDDQIVPRHCPHCHHVLFYNEKKCHYCS